MAVRVLALAGPAARAVRVDNVQHDELLDRIGDRTGTDGRHWDDQLIAVEMLQDLDLIARQRSCFISWRTAFEDVARALRLTQAGGVPRVPAGARSASAAGRPGVDPDDALARKPGGKPSWSGWWTRCTRGPAERRLPGRAIICARANISEVRFARLMGLLVTRGCIVERSARKPGRLVYATPEETLAHLRHQPNE